MRVHRIDFAATLAKPARRADGMMIVEARLARAGVQTYRNADGSTRKEYRPPAEVFDAESLETFRGVPVTNNHPPVMVSAENARNFAVGAVLETPRQDGKWMTGVLVIHDAETIKALESGKVQVSNGYDADVVDHPGTSPDGEYYDAIQTKIIGNHVAIVDVARAGKDAAIRMDAAYSIEPASPERSDIMDPELQTACTKYGIKADDDRAASLALLHKLEVTETYPGSGVRLDGKSEAYLVARAIAAAASHQYNLATRGAEQKSASEARRWGYGDNAQAQPPRERRFDENHTDAEREDDTRFDETAPRYDASGAVCDELEGALVPVESGALRFDQEGYLIGDYERSPALEKARQDAHDALAGACTTPQPGVLETSAEVQQRVSWAEQVSERMRRDRQAADVADRFGTRKQPPRVSMQQVDAARASRIKALQDMRADRAKLYAENESPQIRVLAENESPQVKGQK